MHGWSYHLSAVEQQSHFALWCLAVQAGRGAVGHLCGVEPVQDSQCRLADSLTGGLDDLAGLFASTRAAHVETYGIV